MLSHKIGMTWEPGRRCPRKDTTKIFFTRARNTGHQDICQNIFVVKNISDADSFLNALDITVFISTEGACRNRLPMITIHPTYPSHLPPFALGTLEELVLI